jgi:hypothetical protein
MTGPERQNRRHRSLYRKAHPMTTILEVRQQDDEPLYAVEYHWTPQEGKRYVGQLTGEALRDRCIALLAAIVIGLGLQRLT